jgi:hypothetical protein
MCRLTDTCDLLLVPLPPSGSLVFDGLFSKHMHNGCNGSRRKQDLESYSPKLMAFWPEVDSCNSAGLATCAFWGYCVGHGALALGHALLEASRLPIVFDLDETLLVAYSLHTLDVRLGKLRDSGWQQTLNYDLLLEGIVVVMK